MVIFSDWILSLAIVGNTYKAIYNLPLRFYHLGKHKALHVLISILYLSVERTKKTQSCNGVGWRWDFMICPRKAGLIAIRCKKREKGRERGIFSIFLRKKKKVEFNIRLSECGEVLWR